MPRCGAENAYFGIEGEVLQAAYTRMHGRRRNTSVCGLGHWLCTRKFRRSLGRDVVVHRPCRGHRAMWNHHSKSAVVDPIDLLRCDPCVRSERAQRVRSPERDMLRNRLLRRFSCDRPSLCRAPTPRAYVNRGHLRDSRHGRGGVHDRCGDRRSRNVKPADVRSIGHMPDRSLIKLYHVLDDVLVAHNERAP